MLVAPYAFRAVFLVSFCTMSRVSKTLLVATATVLLWAAPSFAAQSPAVADCNTHGQLTQQYSLQQLRGALVNMPPPVKEYTNCYDVIQRQLLSQLSSSQTGGSGSSKGSGGSFLPVPVIIVLAALLAVAAGYTTLAVRRRGSGGGGPDAS
jgi:hypothetical protein